MISQLFIAVLGVTAVWLSQDARESHRRYACLFGRAAQPFWAYSTIVAGQYVITGLCLFYGYGWFKGFRLYWLKPA